MIVLKMHNVKNNIVIIVKYMHVIHRSSSNNKLISSTYVMYVVYYIKPCARVRGMVHRRMSICDDHDKRIIYSKHLLYVLNFIFFFSFF